jgi:hypothetical protein
MNFMRLSSDGGGATTIYHKAVHHGKIKTLPRRRQTLTVRVRRTGYKPWFGKLDLPKTALAGRPNH